jgi:hypothetical protein
MSKTNTAKNITKNTTENNLCECDDIIIEGEQLTPGIEFSKDSVKESDKDVLISDTLPTYLPSYVFEPYEFYLCDDEQVFGNNPHVIFAENDLMEMTRMKMF